MSQNGIGIGVPYVSFGGFTPLAFGSSLVHWTSPRDPAFYAVSGGSYDSETNRGTFGGTVANTGATRPTQTVVPPAVAVFNGTSQELISSLAASTYTGLQGATGTSFELWLRLRSTSFAAVQTFATTSHGAGTSTIGFHLQANASGNMQVFLTDGGGVSRVLTSSTVALSTNTDYTVRVQIVGGASGTYKLSANATEVSGSLAKAGVGTNPSDTLYLGGINVGTTNLAGRLSDVVIFDRVLSSSEESLIRAYLDGIVLA